MKIVEIHFCFCTTCQNNKIQHHRQQYGSQMVIYIFLCMKVLKKILSPKLIEKYKNKTSYKYHTYTLKQIFQNGEACGVKKKEIKKELFFPFLGHTLCILFQKQQLYINNRRICLREHTQVLPKERATSRILPDQYLIEPAVIIKKLF